MKKYFSSKKTEDFFDVSKEIEISKVGFQKKYSLKNSIFDSYEVRMFAAISLFALAFVVLSARVVYVCSSDRFNAPSAIASTKQLANLSKYPVKRADIIDANGLILATSLPTVNLYANPHKISETKKASQELAKILPDVLYEDILDKLSSKAKFVYIKRNLSPAQQYQINALGIPGLEFESVEKRVYPHKNLLSHLLGATNIDNKGTQGIERYLDERLKTSDIPLQLSVNIGIQDSIKRNLYNGIKHFNAKGGVAILMNVNTSEVVSMVNLPDFDPNDISKSVLKNKFNFATSGTYEPGSVFKVFSVAMGLDSGKININESFDATKPIKLKYNTIKDYRPENRWLTLQEILIHSSNIGTTQIAFKVGAKLQKNFLDNLGFFNTIDIESYEKARPMFPKQWKEETMATVSYGYGVSVTPMHLITAFSAIVNGGVYRKPSFIKTQSPSDGYRVVSESTSKKMRKLLRQVVVEGSGKGANVIGYEVAGKTGTANKLVDGEYINKKVMTTFLATFPSSKPQYALLVMLDEPKATDETFGFVTSGWNTVPIANDIITEIAPQLSISPNDELSFEKEKRIIELSYEKN